MRLTSRLFASFTIAVLLGVAGTVFISAVVMNDMLVRAATWRLELASGSVTAILRGFFDDMQRTGSGNSTAAVDSYKQRIFDYIERAAKRDSFEYAVFAQNGMLVSNRAELSGALSAPENEQNRLAEVSIWGPGIVADRTLAGNADFRAGPGDSRSFVRVDYADSWKWYVTVWVPEDRVWAERGGFLLVVLAFLPIALIIALSAAVLLGRGIVNRVRRTLVYLHKYRDEGFREPISIEKRNGDEIEELQAGFNEMVLARAISERELSAANGELSRLNERLQKLNFELENRVRERTNQLIETEKLAYLGGLVAGISHEVNTPIGTSFTAITFMYERLIQLQNSYKSGAIERGEFERTLTDLIDSSGAIKINLERAAELLQGFKQVAADQIVDDVRELELASYLEQIHLSLKPRMKRTVFQLLIDCQLGLSLRTSPGALAQVITNLVENALVHGLDGRSEGKIEISAGFVAETSVVRITCTDNGAGIAAEHIGKIFNPFFTTKRGTGGTGLGLHIVHNIVTGRLGGTIQVRSEAGAGSTFILDLPATVEKHNQTKPESAEQ